MSTKPHDDRPTQADWTSLGLQPGASIAEVQRAYRHRHTLYSPDSLAMYGLIDDTERSERLQQLDGAYRRILASDDLRRPAPPSMPSPQDSDDPASSAEAYVTEPAEVLNHPGAYLRILRLDRSMTLEDISRETKIRSIVIANLEEERFETLPERVFVRGFVVQLARTLGIRTPEDLAAQYLELMEAARKG